MVFGAEVKIVEHDRKLRPGMSAVINMQIKAKKNVIAVPVTALFVDDKQEYVFDEQEDVLEEFIVQYYSENEPPSELVLPEELDGALIEFLSAIKGKKVRVSVPKRGAKRKLLDLVEKNIQIAFFGDRLKLEALQKAIGLPEPTL